MLWILLYDSMERAVKDESYTKMKGCLFYLLFQMVRFAMKRA
jgi:hypothetical protein